MRSAALLLGLLLLVVPAQAQFVIEEARPQSGAAGVNLSSEVAFAFSEEISVSTNWNTAFRYEPRGGLSYDQVSLCLNLEGDCGGGDDVPRFVRFTVEHEPDTDYTWMVYTVETPDGEPMDAPYVLRYTTRTNIGQQHVGGAVTAPTTKSAAWTPQVRTSLRTLARGFERNGLGRPFYEQDDADTAQPRDEAPSIEAKPTEADASPQAHFGTIGAKTHSGGHTQILLLDEFSVTESAWSVQAADVIEGSSGDYRVEYVRDGTYWPVAVRYTDGSNTEIEALGFHDADGDGAPDPVTIDGTGRTDVDVQLYEFFPTTIRNPRYLTVVQEAAAGYASDQELKLIEAQGGVNAEGMAYTWVYRYYSPSEEFETRITVDPLDVDVDTLSETSFLGSIASVPEPFVDSDEALGQAMANGGEAFIEDGNYRDGNLTTILQGGELYWTTSDPPSEVFWRVRIIAVTSSGADDFEYFTDLSVATSLPSPSNLAVALKEDGAQVTWEADTADDAAGYYLYRAALPAPAKRIATLAAGERGYLDESVAPNQDYRYWVAAFDDDGAQSSFSNAADVSTDYPATLDFDISRSFGDPSAQSSYRLVALPGVEDTPVASTLDGAANEDWTVYWDDGSEQNYLKKHDGSSTFTFRPGRGFWMLSTEAWTASGMVDTAPLAADGTYAIDLHDGWNIIANPFDVDVTWSVVKAANDVSQALWRWNGSFSEASAFASASDGEAFYFLNEEGLDALQIPYPGAAEEPATASAQHAPEHTLALAAFQQDERRSAVRVGIADEAAEGRDDYDQFAPPGDFESATLRLINDAVDAAHTDADLAAEYRSALGAGHTFDLVLRAEPGAAVELRVGGLERFAGQEVVLVDPSVGRAYDLRAEAPVRLRPDAESMELKLLVGSAAFVEGAQDDILPTTLQLLPNYPNPFRTQTRLEFALPEPTSVRLVVYDVLGRRVRTLVDRDVEAGLHPVRWDGRNGAGQPVASGLYLARLEAGAQTRIQRIVLVR